MTLQWPQPRGHDRCGKREDHQTLCFEQLEPPWKHRKPIRGTSIHPGVKAPETPSYMHKDKQKRGRRPKCMTITTCRRHHLLPCPHGVQNAQSAHRDSILSLVGYTAFDHYTRSQCYVEKLEIGADSSFGREISHHFGGRSRKSENHQHNSPHCQEVPVAMVRHTAQFRDDNRIGIVPRHPDAVALPVALAPSVVALHLVSFAVLTEEFAFAGAFAVPWPNTST